MVLGARTAVPLLAPPCRPMLAPMTGVTVRRNAGLATRVLTALGMALLLLVVAVSSAAGAGDRASTSRHDLTLTDAQPLAAQSSKGPAPTPKPTSARKRTETPMSTPAPTKTPAPASTSAPVLPPAPTETPAPAPTPVLPPAATLAPVRTPAPVTPVPVAPTAPPAVLTPAPTSAAIIAPALVVGPAASGSGAPGTGNPADNDPAALLAQANGIATGLDISGASGGSARLEAVLAASRSGPSQLMNQLAPTMVTLLLGLTAWAAFVFFGKRRRDDDDPADSLLAAAAAAGYEGQAATGLQAVDESLMPRWRRPSLQQARRTDPLRAAAEASHMSFGTAGVMPLANFERRVIGYRLVRLLDSPDELRATEIGVVDQGDEVQLLDRHGAYWLVLCPDGRQGWVHRMTLADPEKVTTAEREPQPETQTEPMPQYGFAEPEQPETPEQPEAQGSDMVAEDAETSGLLEAYMKARSIVEAKPGIPVQPEPAAATWPSLETSSGAPPAAKPKRAGAQYSAQKPAGTRKVATSSRPGTKSRRPSK